jgi:CRISPR/Cas system endoribonuclease Cas6 (RAMP superfamily)
MPARLTVELDRALTAPPKRHGAALHGAVLAALDFRDPQLARTLHSKEAGGASPSRSAPASSTGPPALTPVRSEGAGGAFDIGLIDENLAERVVQALEHARLEVDGEGRRVGEVLGVEHAFNDIVADASALTGWTFTFRSPTCVRVRSGPDAPERTEPLPHPSLVFARLLRRWQSCTEVALPGQESLGEVIDGWLAPAAAQLHTERHTTKPPRGWAVGGRGTAVWTLLRPRDVSREVQSGLSALTRFGTLCGVGDHTSRGMGDVSVRPATKRDMRGQFPQ